MLQISTVTLTLTPQLKTSQFGATRSQTAVDLITVCCSFLLLICDYLTHDARGLVHSVIL